MTRNNENRDEEIADITAPVNNETISINRRKFILIITVFSLVTLVSIVVAITLPLTLGKKLKPEKNNHIPNKPPLTEQRTPEMLEYNEVVYQQNKLPVFLPVFSSEILQGYQHCEDLQHDIEQALGFYANNLIKRHMNTYVAYELYDDYYDHYYLMDDMSGPRPVAMPMEMTMDTAETTSTYAAPRAEKITESSFGTNNQHEDVEEADIIKSDGTYVYTVYGRDLVVLDLLGHEVFRLELVELEQNNDDWFFDDTTYSDDNGVSVMMPEKMDSPHESDSSTLDMSKTEGEWANQTTSSTKNLNNRKTSVWMPAQKQITGLTLHGSRLVATISSENYFYVTASSFVTEIVVMDIDLSSGALSIAERKSVNGLHFASRLIDSNVHVVTKAYLYHHNFQEKIDRYSKSFYGMNDTEYALVAFEVANDAIKHHSRMLVQELVSDQNPDSPDYFEGIFADTVWSSETCRHVAKIAMYQDDDGLEDNITPGLELLNAFAKVTSFDVSSTMEESMSVSATFLPSSHTGDFYASKDMLFLGGRGWTRSPLKKEAAGSSVQTIPNHATFITAFQLVGASAIPKATGIIPGYTLNQFSFDYYENHLRIATTSTGRSEWNPITGEEVVITETTNQVIVASIDGDEINVVGMLENLGRSETIYAIRFLGNLAFMVTFRITDPFYTIDLSDPTAPSMIGELKITGFSNYLHPINDDYIIAVGQDADNNGELLGLQIALFDVSDLANPQQIAKHVVEGWSLSESQHDHLAFRYLPMSKKLILPISNAGETKFDGFYIFDIDVDFDKSLDGDGISLDFIVPHYSADDSVHDCYGTSYLQSRSLVFQGDLMTFKGHNVLSHDLTTGTKLFELSLDKDTDSNDCFGWFY